MEEIKMSDLLEEAKQLLEREPRFGENQWQMLAKLLKKAGDQANDILKWVFTEHAGYTAIRAQAGIEFLRRNPVEGWLFLERLIMSNDPDDRDTALTVLAMSDDPRAPELAKPLLRDNWPYLRLDAAGFLKEVYPAEVATALANLLDHQDEWVRNEARKRLTQM
jgi:hypothetical protein